ncbi:MAG: fibronectin type III domain-containing protein [Halobacteriales archaeon]|nr:fibronectin type III domain-containing protein [Halobacteriales archaeon]
MARAGAVLRAGTRRQRALSSDAAVSDVIGNLLTVGITVVMMAAVFVLFIKVPLASDAIHAELRAEVDAGNNGWNTGDEMVVVEHLGGQALPASKTNISIQLDGASFAFGGDAASLGGAFADGKLTVGESWRHTFTIANTTSVGINVLGGSSLLSMGTLNVVSATPSLVPAQPSAATALAGNAQVALTWGAPGSVGGGPISGYKLYRGTSPGSPAFLTQLGLVLAYTDTGLTNGQPYDYAISAVNGFGEGGLTAELPATPATIPGAPQSFAIAAGNAQAVLTWAAPAGDGGNPVTSYRVYRGATSGSEVLLASGGCSGLGSVLTCTDTGLTNGQTYWYQVAAGNAQGIGARAAEKSVVPVSVPGAPGSLTPTASSQQVVLTWTAASQGGSPVTSYKVYRGTASGAETLLASGGCSGLGNVVTCTDAGLANGTTYYYKASAVNAIGEGPQGSEASAALTLPGAPGAFTATAGNAQAVLTWTAASPGGSPVTSYRVYRSTTSNAEALLTSGGCSALGNVLTCTDTGLTNGQTYYYEVAAVNGVGIGALAAEKSATPVAVPGAPLTLVAAHSGGANSGSILLTWAIPASNGGSAITSYKVYRGTSSGSEVLVTSGGCSALGNVLTCTDGGRTKSTVYYYKVSAVNAVGEGPLSNESNAVG